MKKIENLKEIQALNCKILEELKKICDKNKIEFYLLGGTLLGAGLLQRTYRASALEAIKND